MKIIDVERKGHVVRFYLGKDDLEDWWGDDWDDAPYEHNAGQVYDEYVAGHKDVSFPYDDLVLEPADGHSNSTWCKDDMIARKVPCIVVVPGDSIGKDEWLYGFKEAVCRDRAVKFYFGDDESALSPYLEALIIS